jgi:hypothetical protein
MRDKGQLALSAVEMSDLNLQKVVNLRGWQSIKPLDQTHPVAIEVVPQVKPV